ncbi:unnamed protein product [Arabis nemorensis]|uniref:DUF4283 domain-containing protein n=1 Tax=Arabis nemorensis TaxID=586526 RepID=A0A565CC77_9BRAS|nr:unnamed protein product [Arabis nemorensis]
MNAIERWVPTVRMDFPAKNPFWVKIINLPDQHCEKRSVKRIGEDLVEYMDWKDTEPFPMVRVMVECDSSLIFNRETVSDIGEIFYIEFNYVKL